MPKAPERESWEGQSVTWKIALAILSTLLVIPAIGPRWSAYIVQENALMLLVVAALAMVVLLFLIAFVLLKEGVRLGFFWLKARLLGMARFGERQLTRMERMGRLTARH